MPAGRQAGFVERRNGPARRVRDAVASWFGVDPADLKRLDGRAVARMASQVGIERRRSPILVRVIGPGSSRRVDECTVRIPERRDLNARSVRDMVASRCGLHPSELGSLDELTVRRIASRLRIADTARGSALHGWAGDG